eukprot:1338528-Amorphochlora_amoeboformis.AAC.3
MSELVYFDVDGRALEIRLALHIGKIKFTDTRLTFPEFKSLKPSLPYQQVPIYNTGGKTYAQSAAIFSPTVISGICSGFARQHSILYNPRFAAKRAGLYPKDEVKALLVDSICDAVEEISQPLAMTMYRPLLATSLRVREWGSDKKEMLETRKRLSEE